MVFWVTVWVRLLDVLPEKCRSGRRRRREIVCGLVATPSVLVEKVPTPLPFKRAGRSTCEPSSKVTMPAGVPVPTDAPWR